MDSNTLDDINAANLAEDANKKAYFDKQDEIKKENTAIDKAKRDDQFRQQDATSADIEKENAAKNAFSEKLNKLPENYGISDERSKENSKNAELIEGEAPAIQHEETTNAPKVTKQNNSRLGTMEADEYTRLQEAHKLLLAENNKLLLNERRAHDQRVKDVAAREKAVADSEKSGTYGKDKTPYEPKTAIEIRDENRAKYHTGSIDMSADIVRDIVGGTVGLVGELVKEGGKFIKGAIEDAKENKEIRKQNAENLTKALESEKIRVPIRDLPGFKGERDHETSVTYTNEKSEVKAVTETDKKVSCAKSADPESRMAALALSITKFPNGFVVKGSDAGKARAVTTACEAGMGHMIKNKELQDLVKETNRNIEIQKENERDRASALERSKSESQNPPKAVEKAADKAKTDGEKVVAEKVEAKAEAEKPAKPLSEKERLTLEKTEILNEKTKLHEYLNENMGELPSSVMDATLKRFDVLNSDLKEKDSRIKDIDEAESKAKSIAATAEKLPVVEAMKSEKEAFEKELSETNSHLKENRSSMPASIAEASDKRVLELQEAVKAKGESIAEAKHEFITKAQGVGADLNSEAEHQKLIDLISNPQQVVKQEPVAQTEPVVEQKAMKYGASPELLARMNLRKEGKDPLNKQEADLKVDGKTEQAPPPPQPKKDDHIYKI